MERKYHDNKPVLYIVVPCYNEEEVLPITSGLFKEKIESLIRDGVVSSKSKILFINDGSRDSTWSIIKELSKKETVFQGLCLSRNRGHQNALLAGLLEAKDLCDITISIDCDGQDDINAMDKMISEFLDGSDIVYGVRDSRDSDSFFKRFTAQSYYKLLRKMGVDVVYNHADYRLVSARVLDEFAQFEEVNIFLRGLFPLVGFKSSFVYYNRKVRLAGESHYPLSKMLALAYEGITSLSIRPIQFITRFGIFFSFVSALLFLYVIISYLSDRTVPGWSSSLICITLIGGIQLISLGIIGEYIGKIYLETKHRPRYVISERTFEK